MDTSRKSNALVNHSVRMPQELHRQTTDRAIKTGMSVSAVIRMACRQFNDTEAHADKCKKLIIDSKISDMQLIKFSGMKNNATRLYLHRNAFQDLKNSDKKTEDYIMEFMRSSIEDGTLLGKGEVKTSDGSNITLFRVNKMNVYCHFASGQITILSVI